MITIKGNQQIAYQYYVAKTKVNYQIVSNEQITIFLSKKHLESVDLAFKMTSML